MKNQKPESSEQLNVISSTQLAESMLQTEVLKLERLNVGLSQTIDNLLKTIESKDSEISHLKQLLTTGTPIIGDVAALILSDVERITIKQLDRLKKVSDERDLTLDEIKKLDLLNKNKRLEQGTSTVIDTSKKDLPKNMAPNKLIEIASRKIEES